MINIAGMPSPVATNSPWRTESPTSCLLPAPKDCAASTPTTDSKAISTTRISKERSPLMPTAASE